jgi:hypothetical protein
VTRQVTLLLLVLAATSSPAQKPRARELGITLLIGGAAADVARQSCRVTATLHPDALG